MALEKAKTINLLLYDGTLDGVITIADSSWNAGELYSAPREAVKALLEQDACTKYGVYLLLSNEMVYVGQASNLKTRINQHLVGKDWWERVILLTTSNDSLNKSDIDYLESVLIQKAIECDKLDCDNKNTGNKQKVTKFRSIELNQYLDEALFLLELTGITVFKKGSTSSKSAKKVSLPALQSKSQEELEIRAKSEARALLKEYGIVIGKYYTYSKLLSNNSYWMNPQTDFLNHEWDIVLNNQIDKVLTVLRIPANTYQLKTESSDGFSIRKDKPFYIDFRIDKNVTVEINSKTPISKHVIKVIKY